jgi:hypothetical protein
VAWRNYPPVEGSQATVPAAVANLDRVRAFKRAARSARITARHEQALSRAHRRAELAASGIGTSDRAHGADVTSRISVDLLCAIGRPLPDVATIASLPRPAMLAADAHLTTGAGHGEEPSPGEARVPATAATITQWAQTRVAMCAGGDVVRGPLNDDTHTRARCGLSAKQLRNIRNAATSGALRRRAEQLGVELPMDYVDCPALAGANGREPGRKVAHRL